MAYQKSDVHISQPLTNFALRYVQDKANMVADKLAPQVPSKKESDKYFTYDRANWRITDDLRSPGDMPNRSNTPALSTSSFLIEEYSLYDIVPYRVIEDADTPLQPKQDTAADLLEQLMVAKEKRAADTLFATAAAANYVAFSATVQWGYTSTTTPINDFTTGIFSMIQEIGRKPNQATIGNAAWQTLKNHADVLDRIKYTERGILTPDLVAAVVDLDTINLGVAVNMTTAPGIASEAVSYIWGKHVLIQYTNPRPSKKSMTHATQFTKKGGTAQVKEFDKKENNGVWVEAGLYYDFKIVSTLCGYLMFDVVA